MYLSFRLLYLSMQAILMRNKKYYHVIWIIFLTCVMVLLEYLFEGRISKGTLVKSLIFALIMEFGHYCMIEYRKENEDATDI